MSKAFDDNDRTNKWIKNQLNSTKYRGYNVEQCVNQSKERSFKEKLIYEDGKVRGQIHITIINMLRDGKSKLEILLALQSKNEYKKFAPYFKTWINSAYNKQHETVKYKEEGREKVNE